MILQYRCTAAKKVENKKGVETATLEFLGRGGTSKITVENTGQTVTDYVKDKFYSINVEPLTPVETGTPAAARAKELKRGPMPAPDLKAPSEQKKSKTPKAKSKRK